MISSSLDLAAESRAQMRDLSFRQKNFFLSESIPFLGGLACQFQNEKLIFPESLIASQSIPPD